MEHAGAINDRDRQLMGLLWREGPLSRWEIHQRTGIHPNLIGQSAQRLIRARALRQAAAQPDGAAGRPRLPLEIDPQERNVVGLAIAPGEVQATKLNLRGALLGKSHSQRVRSPDKLVASAARLLSSVLDDRALAVGISVTGFVDPQRQTVLFSSAAPTAGHLNLAPIVQAAQDVHKGKPIPAGRRRSKSRGSSSDDASPNTRGSEMPVILSNDMHALAARWVLTHRADARDDVVLVGLEDGRVGASLQVQGRPNSGCVMAANELGHMRLPVETERCYCGHSGCIERIFSTKFLHRIGVPRTRTLADVIADPARDATSLQRLAGYIATALANIVNFVRPARLVIASPFARQHDFADALGSAVRGLMLCELAQRVRIDWWDERTVQSAENAAWLGLACLYGPNGG